MKLTSPAFDNGSTIPREHTCEGGDVSLPLRFDDVPENARSLVLIMDDHDVPRNLRGDGIWDHWVVYDIPPDVRGTSAGEEPPGSHGQGTSGNLGYAGPCPPDREHRYFINLYALDTTLGLAANPTKAEVLRAMDGHVLERATLMGRYGSVKY